MAPRPSSPLMGLILGVVALLVLLLILFNDPGLLFFTRGGP